MDLKIFTDNIEEKALQQINTLMAQPAFADCKVRIMPDVHAGAGCVIGFTADLGDKVIPNIVGVDIGCLDAETEFITETGFKKISEYKQGDKVLQYDPETDEASFVEPYCYIDQPCDLFYHFVNSKGLDQMVSQEHRMLVYRGRKGIGYTYEDIQPVKLISKKREKGFYCFKAAFSMKGDGVDLTDDQIRLIIAICADGSIRQTSEKRTEIRFHFAKQRKIGRIKELLSKNNISYTVSDRGATCEINISSTNNDISAYKKDMTMLYRCNRHQLEVIAKECLLWDGYKGYRSFFASTNKQFADFIQFAFSATNVRAGMHVVKNDSRSDCYNVIPTKNEYVGYTCDVKEIRCDNMRKYCFVVPSSYFVIRRNGKIAITGNCGMLTLELGKREIDFEKLDDVIRKNVPSGLNVHDSDAPQYRRFKVGFDLNDLHCGLSNKDWLEHSLGTLGGGNHFIEVDADDDGNKYLVVHTGSRNIGKQVADWWQETAIERLSGREDFLLQRNELIARLKAEGKHSEIADALRAFDGEHRPQVSCPNELCWLEGIDRERYLHDMEFCQRFARWNRLEIAYTICVNMGWRPVTNWFETVHNYIDLETNIVRKGAISAKKGERVLIPMNMRDGCIIGIGKGNEDWNCSAPHGAGRIMSRAQAKKNIPIATYRASMDGIWSSTVTEKTLDESPMAYKPMDEILKYIEPTIEVERIIKPVYNFKVAE